MNKLQPDKVQGSVIQIRPLSKYKDVLLVFEELVCSIRGPLGRASMLQNTSGGNLVLTSSSRLLMSSLSVEKALIRLIISACQSHMSVFNDGGLFLMGLSAKLVREGLETDRNPVFLSDIFEVFLTMLLEHLNSPSCLFRIKIRMSDLQFMSSIVNTILKSKPLCQWNDVNVKHIGRLIIECFLTSVDEVNMLSSESVYIQCEEGYDVSESFIKQGILLPAPEMSRFNEKMIEIKQCKNEGTNMIKVALVTVSLSGDMEELSGVKYNLSDSVDFDDVVVDRLGEFCDILIGQQVGLVLCQKVIHPELKYRLCQKGLVVVDRIGYQPVSYIQSLTGALPIQCLDLSEGIQNRFGWLSDVSHHIVHGKSYLLLNQEGGHMTTLYLCHQQEEHLNELKDVCNTALVSLRHLLYEPYVLPGGGCWQTLLASHLAKQVKTNIKDLCTELGCSETVLTDACGLFMKSLIAASTSKLTKYSINCENGHLYCRGEMENEGCEIYCCCGLEERTVSDVFREIDCNGVREFGLVELFDHVIQKEMTEDFVLGKVKTREVIVDSFAMCRNALQTSVLTAVSALRIGQVIEETF